MNNPVWMAGDKEWKNWLWESGQSERLAAISAMVKAIGEASLSEDDEFRIAKKLREILLEITR